MRFLLSHGDAVTYHPAFLGELARCTGLGLADVLERAPEQGPSFVVLEPTGDERS